MSVKIKIKWDDSNAISEGVHIYKSASAFTSSSLPALYETIAYGIDEFEDLDVIENQTYFYMLSCFLDEQEAFTECYEIKASAGEPLPKIVQLGAESVIFTATNLNVYDFYISFFSDDGLKFFVSKNVLRADEEIQIACCACATPFNLPSSPVFNDVALGVFGRSLASVHFFGGGMYAVLSFYKTSSYVKHYAIIALTNKYDLADCTLLSEHSNTLTNNAIVMPSNDGKYLYFVGTNTATIRYDVVGSLIGAFALSNAASFNLHTLYGTADVQGVALSEDSKSMLIITGNILSTQQKTIISSKFEKYNLESDRVQHTVPRGVDFDLVRGNMTNRFLYKHNNEWFMIWSKSTSSNPKCFKQIVSTEEWI